MSEEKKEEGLSEVYMGMLGTLAEAAGGVDALAAALLEVVIKDDVLTLNWHGVSLVVPRSVAKQLIQKLLKEGIARHVVDARLPKIEIRPYETDKPCNPTTPLPAPDPGKTPPYPVMPWADPRPWLDQLPAGPVWVWLPEHAPQYIATCAVGAHHGKA